MYERLACRGITIAVLLALGGDAAAGGSSTSTFGGRRNGMLTVIGQPDDPTALFHNPAGLALQPGMQIYGFVSPAFFSTDFSMQALDAKRFPEINPPGCGNKGAPPCPWPVGADGYYTRGIEPERYFGILPYLGVSTDLGRFGAKWRDVVVSAALFTPNLYGAVLPRGAPTAYYIIGGFFAVGSATIGLGAKINRFISVGANVSYNVMYLSLSQKLSLANSLTRPGETPAGMASLAQSLIGDLVLDYAGIDHGVGWNVSLLITPMRWLRIGLGYAGATSPKFDGDVSFQAQRKAVKDQATFDKLVHAAGYKLPKRLVIEMPLPHSLQIGFNFFWGSRVEIGADARLWFYNAFKKQVLRPSYDPNEPGKEPLTEASLSRDKNYGLSYQFALGLLVRPLRRLLGLELMIGLGYDQSPIPDSTFSLDNPNLSHVKFTTGVRYRVNEHWRVSASYLLNLYISRDVKDSVTNPPTNVRVASRSHSPALAATYRF